MSAMISPTVLKALIDFTGEPRVDIAVRLALRDAARFKLEELESALKRLEEKYRMIFPEFERAFQNEEIPDTFSYEVEGDYLEWQGLRSRKKRVEDVLRWLE
ncbi:MAG: hypothetical protein KAV99_00300 [Candidatus Latescibacteria bacterium]|nr:hypothetical protein [Candidatus Latescibacterota bacterium]